MQESSSKVGLHVHSIVLLNYMCTNKHLVVCNAIMDTSILIAKDISFRMVNSRAIILCQQIFEAEVV